MSIILNTEKRHISTLLLYGALYTLLILGAISMVYPFLLMVSGSMKSRVDSLDLDIIPAYLYADEVLFKKHQESKYGEDLQLYLQTTGDPIRNFRAITIPATDHTQLLTDWNDFLDQADIPDSWFMTGFGPTLEGKIIQKNERAFRNHIRDLCGEDLITFQTTFNEPIENWFFLKFKAERLIDRKYQVSDTELMKAFYEFKHTLPREDRIYVSCDRAFQRYVRLQGKQAGETLLTSTPTSPEWESFVRTTLHPQFIQFAPSAARGWTNYLRSIYSNVSQLNQVYGKTYTSIAEVPLPENRLTASPALTDLLSWITQPDFISLEELRVDTPEIQWRNFLATRYDTIEATATAHGRLYGSWGDVRMPQREADAAFCETQSGPLRRDFASSNFKMVFEFILFYGHGVHNTVIFCTLSIVLALLVNPLAAYALSRYNLPSQYKILLFLIATMAFPGVVTMIPNFLLLRDLGLLNTFAALLLPSMANGYSIFLLKGFFDSLPKELFEAASIDGANEWHKFWIITMNLSKPILAVIALGAFNGAYSNFMYAFILCQDRDMWTLMVWLYQLQQFSSQGVVFASLLIAAIPTLLIFVLCQNVIIKGIVVPTEK